MLLVHACAVSDYDIQAVLWQLRRGFCMIVLQLYGDAVGTKVSGRCRQGGRSSGVAVKRGSTVGITL